MLYPDGGMERDQKWHSGYKAGEDIRTEKGEVDGFEGRNNHLSVSSHVGSWQEFSFRIIPSESRLKSVYPLRDNPKGSIGHPALVVSSR